MFQMANISSLCARSQNQTGKTRRVANDTNAPQRLSCRVSPFLSTAASFRRQGCDMKPSRASCLSFALSISAVATGVAAEQFGIYCREMPRISVGEAMRPFEPRRTGYLRHRFIRRRDAAPVCRPPRAYGFKEVFKIVVSHFTSMALTARNEVVSSSRWRLTLRCTARRSAPGGTHTAIAPPLHPPPRWAFGT